MIRPNAKQKGNVNIMNQKKLVEIMVELLKVSEEDVTDEMSVENCDSWDSLVHVELLSSLEEAFDVDFDIQDAIEIDSVAEIKRVLTEKGVEF